MLNETDVCETYTLIGQTANSRDRRSHIIWSQGDHSDYSPLLEGWQPKVDGVSWPTGLSTPTLPIIT